MWRILKAEFEYTGGALIVGYGIAILFFILAASTRSWNLTGYMWNTTIIYFILMGSVSNQVIAEKRYRFHSTLPVTPEQLTVVDGLYVLIVQLGMSLLWIAMLFFKPESRTASTFWLMLTNNATILCLIMMFGIHYNLGFFDTQKYKRINYVILLVLFLVIVGLIYFGTIDDLARFLWRYYSSPAGASTSLALCTLLTAVNSTLFIRRKSYLM